MIKYAWLIAIIFLLSIALSDSKFCCNIPPTSPAYLQHLQTKTSTTTTATTTTTTPSVWPAPNVINFQPLSRLRFSPHLCLDFHIHSKPTIHIHSTILFAFQHFCKHIPLHTKGKLITTLLIDITQNSSELTYNSDESYTLNLQAPITEIHSPEQWGARHAIETLLQLTMSDSTDSSFPAVVVRDSPKHKWRGMLIDTARHYFSIASLKRTIQALATNKYNVFHWHITDSQSFPIVLDDAPELALHGTHSSNLKYTKEDVQELVSFGLKHGIRIVPEIDVPSHTASWSGAYPDIVLKCRRHANSDADRFKAADKDTLDPTLEKTYQVVSWVIKSLSEMFPDKYIHLGGDEVDTRCITSRKDVMLRGKNQNIGTTALELIQYFWDRVTKMVIDRGKIPIVWQGAMDAGVRFRKEVVVQTWQCWGNPILGVRSMRKALKKKHPVLQSSCWYLDWNSRFSDFYEQERMGSDGRSSRNSKNNGGVIGGEMCAWSETSDEYNTECRLWPRGLATAERLWSSSSSRSKVNANVIHRRDIQTRKMTTRGIISIPAASNSQGQMNYNGIDAKDDFCNHIAQHFQRDVNIISIRQNIPHFYVMEFRELNDKVLLWMSSKYDNKALGYIVVVKLSGKEQRKKKYQSLSKGLGMPHLISCSLQTGVLLMFGLYGIPSVDCSRFLFRQQVHFATVKFIQKTRNGGIETVNVALETKNGMKSSFGTNYRNLRMSGD